MSRRTLVSNARRAVIAALAPAPALAVVALPAVAAPAQPAPPQGVELRSQYEIDHPACDISRDGGVSVRVPGTTNQSLWLFGDTGVGPEGTSCEYKSLGTNGAISINTPGQVPIVSEIPTPGLNGQPGQLIGSLPNGTRRPARFLPNPTGLVESDGVTPCDPANGSIGLSWFGGATIGPNQPLDLQYEGTPVHIANAANLVFVSYEEVCSEPATLVVTGERVSWVAWDPSINSIVAKWTLWDGLTDSDTLSPHHHGVPLGSPQFVAGAGLVAYGGGCTEEVEYECLSGKVVMVGTYMDNLDDPAGYKYFTGTGSGWTYEYNEATPMHALQTSGKGPFTSDVGDYSSTGDGQLMIDHNNIYDGNYQLWKKGQGLASWTLVKDAVMPGTDCGAGYGCYAYYPHPEISTSSDVMFSFHDAESGEVEISSIGALP